MNSCHSTSLLGRGISLTQFHFPIQSAAPCLSIGSTLLHPCTVRDCGCDFSTSIYDLISDMNFDILSAQHKVQIQADSTENFTLWWQPMKELLCYVGKVYWWSILDLYCWFTSPTFFDNLKPWWRKSQIHLKPSQLVASLHLFRSFSLRSFPRS